MTRLSNSLLFDAKTYVRPLITVSMGGFEKGGAPLVVELKVCPCRTTNVKLKFSSSSVFNRSMNEGDDDWPGSGS